MSKRKAECVEEQQRKATKMSPAEKDEEKKPTNFQDLAQELRDKCYEQAIPTEMHLKIHYATYPDDSVPGHLIECLNAKDFQTMGALMGVSKKVKSDMIEAAKRDIPKNMTIVIDCRATHNLRILDVDYGFDPESYQPPESFFKNCQEIRFVVPVRIRLRNIPPTDWSSDEHFKCTQYGALDITYARESYYEDGINYQPGEEEEIMSSYELRKAEANAAGLEYSLKDHIRNSKFRPRWAAKRIEWTPKTTPDALASKDLQSGIDTLIASLRTKKFKGALTRGSILQFLGYLYKRNGQDIPWLFWQAAGSKNDPWRLEPCEYQGYHGPLRVFFDMERRTFPIPGWIDYPRDATELDRLGWDKSLKEDYFNRFGRREYQAWLKAIGSDDDGDSEDAIDRV